MTSMLKFYSLAIVVEDKKRFSSDITVYPVEAIPLVNGLLKNKAEEVANNKTMLGQAVTSKTTKGNVLTATWLPFSTSNRYSSPDVVANETVMLFKYADVDEYYWTTIFSEPGLRRKETVLYMYGNTDKYGETLGPDNSYWSQVSCHDKHIKVHTSDNDGELTTYDITIDTAAGNITIEDGRGNKINLDSSQDTLNVTLMKDLNITLKDKTDVKLNKLAISNTTAEVMQTLSDYIQASSDEQHVGNFGILTVVCPSSKAKYAALKAKVDSFI